MDALIMAVELLYEASGGVPVRLYDARKVRRERGESLPNQPSSCTFHAPETFHVGIHRALVSRPIWFEPS